MYNIEPINSSSSSIFNDQLLPSWITRQQLFNPNKPITSIYHMSNLVQVVQSFLINQLFCPLIMRQNWCNFSIRINQSPPPSIYHVSNFAQGVQSDSINQLFRPLISMSNLVQFFKPNKTITSSLHLSCVKLRAIWLNHSTLPSDNHVSNLVQFFNRNQSITSSLYLSCVKHCSRGPIWLNQ